MFRGETSRWEPAVPAEAGRAILGGDIRWTLHRRPKPVVRTSREAIPPEPHNTAPPAESWDGDGASLHGRRSRFLTCRSCICCLPATPDCSGAVLPTRRVPAQHPTEKQNPDPKYPSKRAARTYRHPPCERTCGRTSRTRFLARRLPACAGEPRSGAAPEGQPDRCSRVGRTPPVGSDFGHFRAARDAVVARCAAPKGGAASGASDGATAAELLRRGSHQAAPSAEPRQRPRGGFGLTLAGGGFIHAFARSTWAPSASTCPEGLATLPAGGGRLRSRSFARSEDRASEIRF